MGVVRVKWEKLSVIGVGLVLPVVAIIINTRNSRKEVKAYNPSQLTQEESEVLLKEVDDFPEFFAKKGGFYKQVSEEMKKEGYGNSIAGTIYSKDDIRLSITIPNNVVVTAQEQEKITHIFRDMISKNNLDPKAFKIEVTQEG
jgi:uncharacterized protein (DUF302 family)